MLARRAVAALTALSLITGSLAVMAPAFADEPSAADKATAHTLMDDGRKKAAAGDHQGALDAFLAAEAIMHVPTTGLAVGKEYLALGKLVEARDALRSAARFGVQPKEPKPFTEARQDADKLADDIEARIPTVKVSVVGVPDGTEQHVSVDGHEIPAAALSVGVKVDPGAHTVEVKAGPAQKKSEVEIAESETKDVAIEFTKEDFVVVPPPVSPITDLPPAVEAPPPSSTPKILMISGFSLAGAGLLVGGITGLMSMSKTSSIKKQCNDNLCPASTHSDLSSARGLATISTISFIAAGVGAGVGLIGFFMRPKSSTSTDATTDTGTVSEPPPPATDVTTPPSDTPAPSPVETPPPETSSRGPSIIPWIGFGSAGIFGEF